MLDETDVMSPNVLECSYFLHPSADILGMSCRELTHSQVGFDHLPDDFRRNKFERGGNFSSRFH